MSASLWSALDPRLVDDLASRFTVAIDIEENVRTPDGQGGYSDDWQTVVSDEPAAVEPLTGQERLTAGQAAALLTDRVVIRYREGITSKMRVIERHGKRILEVSSVADYGRAGIFLELMCQETEERKT